MNPDAFLLLGKRIDRRCPVPVLHQALRIAIYDEFRAWSLYGAVLARFGRVEPFVHIREAEVRHIQALTPLFYKYGVPLPENDWALKLAVPKSVLDCCVLGVEGEIANYLMYQHLLACIHLPDARRVFTTLGAVSINHHLPAFQRCVETYPAMAPQYQGSPRRVSGFVPGLLFGGGIMLAGRMMLR